MFWYFFNFALAVPSALLLCWNVYTGGLWAGNFNYYRRNLEPIRYQVYLSIISVGTVIGLCSPILIDDWALSASPVEWPSTLRKLLSFSAVTCTAHVTWYIMGLIATGWGAMRRCVSTRRSDSQPGTRL